MFGELGQLEGLSIGKTEITPLGLLAICQALPGLTFISIRSTVITIR